MSRGFSVIELLIVVTVGAVVASFASVQLGSIMKEAHANDAVQLVENQLRKIHENAVDDRIEYVVTFTAPGSMTIQFLRNGALLNSSIVNLPPDEQFALVPGFPASPKTPDGFGNANSAIDFDQANGGGSNVLYFYPDGTVLNATGGPNNGVVYIAHPGDLGSARAVSIWGATGRVKAWKLMMTAGVPQWR
jgi:prepilin-type N-terminal cleavage/methylation domain-containing protein